MKMTRYGIRFILFLFFIFFQIYPSVVKTPLNDKKFILVLHSYHHGFKWTDDISQAIEDRFFDQRLKLDINFEYMDTKRIYNPEYLHLLDELFQEKYKDVKIDLVITSDDNALNFFLDHRKDIFKGVPVVFCGKNYLDPDTIKDISKITGVNEFVDIRDNLNLIKNLQPSVNHIYIIVENTTTGNIVRNEIEKIIPEFKKDFRFTIYSDTDIYTLLENVSEVSGNSVILYTLFMRDNKNKAFESYEMMNLLSENSSVPIYGTWDFNLGFGLLGGKLTSGYYQGQKAAEMAEEILQGAPADSIPIVIASPNQYMFDYVQLNKFKIDMKKLPKNCIIINEPHSFFSENKSLVVNVIAIFFLLIIIIALLLSNIQKRRIAQKSLRKSEERYRSVFENSLIGIFKTDLNSNVLIANPAFINMLGFRSFEELRAGDLKNEEKLWIKLKEKVTKHFKNSDELIGYEVKTKRNDGADIFLRLNIRKVVDENNVIILEGFAEDITQQKKAISAIKLAKTEAEKSDKLKTEFLAQMSHEIRTPINTILSFASLLRDSIQFAPDDDLYDSFQIIDRAGKRIIRTVNLLLDMSQIQTDTFETSFHNISLCKDVAEPLFLEFYKVAKDKNLELTFTNRSLECDLFTDEYTVTQILHNLIDNAIKYTNTGSVNLLIYNPAAKNRLCVEVSDTGIGISEEYLPFLFHPFTQEEQGYTRKFEGNGLGLALVQKYCELVNAEISVESVKGKGTTFTVIFTSSTEKNDNRI